MSDDQREINTKEPATTPPADPVSETPIKPPTTQDSETIETYNRLQLKKTQFLMVASGLVLVLLGLLLVAYQLGYAHSLAVILSQRFKTFEPIAYRLNQQKENLPINPAQSPEPSPSVEPSPTPTPVPTTFLDVEYISKTQSFAVSFISDERLESTTDFTFFRVGTIKGGELDTTELLLATIKENRPCKGGGCGLPSYARFLRSGQTMTYLPHISNSLSADELDKLKTVLQQEENITLEIDYELSIVALEKPETLTSGVNGQVVYGAFEFEQTIDEEKLRKIFTDDKYGDVYMTKENLSVQAFFIEENGEYSDLVEGMGTVCPGRGCFLTNAFFLFRPDGTVLRYDVGKKHTQLQLDDPITLGDAQYSLNTQYSCMGSFDSVAVLSPDLVPETDIEQTELRFNDLPIYSLKNSDHVLIKDFYTFYSGMDKEYVGSNYAFKSYEEFKLSTPIMIWKDPFGRLIRLANTDYLPPIACEPIVYLYPETETEVSLQVDASVKLLKTNPQHGVEGWKVFAEPNGRLTETTTGEVYPYLFWEGYRSVIPRSNQGFVVEQEKVEMVLRFALTKYGLVEHEIEDFLDAWLPKFTGAPYYFISFYPQEIIDSVYPLNVEPKPETVIRVLMDYWRLEVPLTVEPLDLPQTPPVRTGFTLVEWGGLER